MLKFDIKLFSRVSSTFVSEVNSRNLPYSSWNTIQATVKTKTSLRENAIALKEQSTQKWKFSHYRLPLMLMASQKFRSFEFITDERCSILPKSWSSWGLEKRNLKWDEFSLWMNFKWCSVSFMSLSVNTKNKLSNLWTQLWNCRHFPLLSFRLLPAIIRDDAALLQSVQAGRMWTLCSVSTWLLGPNWSLQMVCVCMCVCVHMYMIVITARLVSEADTHAIHLFW